MRAKLLCVIITDGQHKIGSTLLLAWCRTLFRQFNMASNKFIGVINNSHLTVETKQQKTTKRSIETGWQVQLYLGNFIGCFYCPHWKWLYRRMKCAVSSVLECFCACMLLSITLSKFNYDRLGKPQRHNMFWLKIEYHQSIQWPTL